MYCSVLPHAISLNLHLLGVCDLDPLFGSTMRGEHHLWIHFRGILTMAVLLATHDHTTVVEAFTQPPSKHRPPKSSSSPSPSSALCGGSTNPFPQPNYGDYVNDDNNYRRANPPPPQRHNGHVQPSASSYRRDSDHDDSDRFEYLPPRVDLHSSAQPVSTTRNPPPGVPKQYYPPPPTPYRSSDDDDDYASSSWQRDVQHWQDQVGQLASDLAFVSKNMGWDEERLWDRFQEAQSIVTSQLQDSIQEIRKSLTTQDTKLQFLYQRSKDQSQRIDHLSQTNNIGASSSSSINEGVEARLQALEERLVQQYEVMQLLAKPDPRLRAMEETLEEHEKLLQQGRIGDPQAIQTKLQQLQNELTVLRQEQSPSKARLDALQEQLILRQERQPKMSNGNNNNSNDPRIAALEAKLQMQEDQLRQATLAISDARISSLRTKLIEQQEQLEGATGRKKTKRTTNPSPAIFGKKSNNPSSKEEATSKGWAPFRGWNTAESKDTERAAATAGIDEESLTSPPFETYESRRPQPPPRMPPPPQPFSYQVPPPPQEDPVGSRRVRKPPTPPQRPPAAVEEFPMYSPPPSLSSPPPRSASRFAPPQPTRQSTPPPPPRKASGGGFRGNPFGRAGGVTIATEDDQKPVEVGVPRRSIAESARGYDSYYRPSSPSPRRPPSSDQDQWRQDALDPDDMARYSREQQPPRASKITSDQDVWDPTAPNPDAVKRQPVANPSGPGQRPPVQAATPHHAMGSPPSANGYVQPTSISRRRNTSGGGVTSDQGRLSSASRVARDVDDWKVAGRPPAASYRSHAQPQQQPPQSQSWRQPPPRVAEDDLFMKEEVMDEYMKWCENYRKEPNEYRFRIFYAKYAEQAAQQQFPLLDEFADYTEEELSRMDR